MYRYEWVDLINDALLEELAQIAGIDPQATSLINKKPLEIIFPRVGGLPVTDHTWSSDECLTQAKLWLSESVQHTLSLIFPLRKQYGYYAVNTQQSPISQCFNYLNKVLINSASSKEISQLPGIGSGLARTIVEERQKNGVFSSLEDLAERINGIGQGKAVKIAHTVSFEGLPGAALKDVGFSMDLVEGLSRLIDIQIPDKRIDKLNSALDLMATHLKEKQHPATTNLFKRNYPETIPELPHLADDVGILWSGEYWHQVPLIMAEASQRIDIALFHAALSDENHPTMQLLNALADAVIRGVSVRVLLDQDRENDPYKSTVINTPAFEFLERNGVDCKFDTQELLLHSKFICIDQQISIIGSHNWSAGSYFQFDDLSLVIFSSAYTAELLDKFEQLWAAS